jgi:hypothetical protein
MRIDVERELAALQGMTIPELQERYEQVFHETNTTKHKPYLIKRIIWRMQANARGGISYRARQRAIELARDSDVRLTAPKPPPRGDGEVVTRPAPAAILDHETDILPGTKLERVYKGRLILAEIVENGVRWEGELYGSLSGVAKAVTGSHWNGRAFFGLKSKKRSTDNGNND